MIPWQHLVRWGGGSQDLQDRSGSIPEDSTWGGNLIFRHHRCNYRKHCASSSIHFHFQDKKPSPSSEAASSSPEASTAKKSNVWIPEQQNIYIEFTIHRHQHQHQHQHHHHHQHQHQHHHHHQDVHQSYFLPHDEDCVGRPWAVTRVSLACLRVSPLQTTHSLTTQ